MLGAFLSSAGGIVFGASPLGITPVKDFKKTSSSRWADHEVHLNLPLSEYLGSQLCEVDVELSFLQGVTTDPNFAMIQLEIIHNLAAPGVLVMGLRPMGRLESMFTIRSLSQDIKYWNTDGSALGASVSVKFKEYVPTTIALGGVLGQVLSAF